MRKFFERLTANEKTALAIALVGVLVLLFNCTGGRSA